MPPSKSGIADYSAALVEPLADLAKVDVFAEAPASFNPAAYDVALYQIGNNGYHSFAYERALQTPGVVVLHESNLHHLIAERTIKRDDWDAYMREVEFDGGAEALAYARQVRALEVGPDYEGVPMLKRLLIASKGVVVHSHYVERDVRNAGYEGPVEVIPHGAWIPDADRLGKREKLGIDRTTPLVGVFGFLKPYKRIAESLRAFKRVLRVHANARMILVGEPHPDFPLQSIIDGLGLQAAVRILGFTPIQDFVNYIAACDIILNLRYPTVGESSGTLLRSLGLGRAVIVSNIGSFAEYPDTICLKVPVDATEEDTLFEYLNLLVERPDLRQTLGDNARAWVERECNWNSVAERYARFLQAISAGVEWPLAKVAAASTTTSVEPAPQRQAIVVEPEYVLGWAENAEARSYVNTHITRLAKTLAITPAGASDKRILEMGSYLQITPALKTKLGYGEVRGCYYGPAGQVDRKAIQSENGEVFECDVDLFDAEKDPFPYPDEYFDTILCCELIEHLPSDPMHMMSEINRILKPGGHVVITTPNIVSARALSAILQGYHPGFFPAYIRPAEPGAEVEARHAREYAPREIKHLFLDAGFDTVLLETGEFLDEPHPEHAWVRHLLETYEVTTELRGDGIYAVGQKRGPVRDRYPAWLYN
ncbi:MAG TPA: glycosyltransferase [Bryobacteraceae bacterium]|nr:glycosyltransferase [Bryobacteraceae bacterium]